LGETIQLIRKEAADHIATRPECEGLVVDLLRQSQGLPIGREHGREGMVRSERLD
jgi:hypothetical protein